MFRIIIIVILFFMSANVYAREVVSVDIIATKTLKRGQVLTDSDIKPNNGYLPEDLRKQYIGKEIKRTVYAGHKILPAYLTSPQLVKRNEMVSMVYNYGVMQLSAKGRALQSGAKGDVISVINISSRKKIMAVVMGDKQVEVGK